MQKKWITILMISFMILVIIGVIVLVKPKEESKEEDRNFKIVTSFEPIYVITSNIVKEGQNIELVNMTENNVGCLHDYTLSTSDMKKMEHANILIENGLGLESFNEKIVRSLSETKSN